jgi:hypothetical protein
MHVHEHVRRRAIFAQGRIQGCLEHILVSAFRTRLPPAAKAAGRKKYGMTWETFLRENDMAFAGDFPRGSKSWHFGNSANRRCV